MQNINLKYSVNTFERLFIDKSIESLYINTIDSYRLKLHNPKTLVEELIVVAQSSINGVLTNNDYVSYTSKELKKLLDEGNDELNFKKISKKHFNDLLYKPDRSKYRLIIQSSKLILKDNQNYCKNLFAKIRDILNLHITFFDNNNILIEAERKNYEEQRKKLIVLIDYLYVELVNSGFTKQYLYRAIHNIFAHGKEPSTFIENLNRFQDIIEKEEEDYTVIFAMSDQSFNFDEFSKMDNNYTLVDRKYRRKKLRHISEHGNKYIERFKTQMLIAVNFRAKDYFKAVQLAINKISKDLDIYHLGFSNKFYKIESHSVVIQEDDPTKALVIPNNFQIDGYFKSDSDIYNILLSQLNRIKENSAIEKESLDKIMSAIRYYRTGGESIELESKFLNYWIGLEFIFTSFSTDEKTIDRMRYYFPLCHSLIYVHRNLNDFHKAIKRLNVDSYLSDYNDSLKYFAKFSNFEIIEKNTDCELLKFRTNYFKKWYEQPNKITDVLRRHQDNLTWNLTRLYRIRNEIVHNAAIKSDIYAHIAHLKYYLSFILNSILYFMANSSVDVDNDGKISIDDFFISQDIMLGTLKNSKLESYLEVEKSYDFFQ